MKYRLKDEKIPDVFADANEMETKNGLLILKEGKDEFYTELEKASKILPVDHRLPVYQGIAVAWLNTRKQYNTQKDPSYGAKLSQTAEEKKKDYYEISSRRPLRRPRRLFSD